MAASRAAQHAERGGLALPARRLALQPAHAVIRVLHRGGIGRLAREGQVDRGDQHPARGERARHRLVGEAILVVPGAAVQVEQHREGTRAERLVEARHELAAPRGAAEGQLVDFDVEFCSGIVGDVHGPNFLT